MLPEFTEDFGRPTTSASGCTCPLDMPPAEYDPACAFCSRAARVFALLQPPAAGVAPLNLASTLPSRRTR